MPFVQFDPSGDVESLFLVDNGERTFLPLSDIRVLHFLQSSDPALTNALLNASDDAHRMLLNSLIALLIQKQAPGLEQGEQEKSRLVAHASLANLINTVEVDEEDALHSLAQSDRNTVRIIEDVIDILIRRDVIALSDLPQGAQQLLAMRRALRAYLTDTGVDD